MKRDASLAGVSYLAITVLMAWPLVRDIDQRVSNDVGDPVLNTWILWWNTTGIPFTERWWNPPVFHPASDVLAYSEHLLGISLWSAPVYWLTGSPIIAYNVAFLLTFPLSGIAVYLLVADLTGRRDASWLAGLAFAFAPYRMDHLAHIQVLSSYWMPLGLFALHRYYRDHRRSWLVLFGGCVVLTGLCNGYYLLFYPALVGPWVLWFTTNEGWWRKVSAIAATGALAALLLAPTLLTYQRVHDDIGFSRPPEEIRAFSADVSGLLSGSGHLAAWKFPEGVHRAEGQLFPGLMVILLIGLGLRSATWKSRGTEPSALRVVRYAVGAVSVVLAAALAVRAVFGPWEINLAGLSISVARPANAIAQGMLFWFLSAVLSPVGAWSYRRHSPFAFYAMAAFFLFVLCLGPEPKALGNDFMAHSAYKALLWMPGYESLRVPARFWMLATICLSVLAGLGFARIVRCTMTPVRRRLALAVATLGVLADGWVIWPTVQAPATATLLGDQSGVVLNLPLGQPRRDAASMLQAISHGQPIVNGYSGHAPPHYWVLRHGLQRRQHGTLDVLAGIGVRTVRIDRMLDRRSSHEQFVARYPGARLLAQDAREAVYRLPPHRDLTRPEPLGHELMIESVSSPTHPNSVQRAVDRSLETRWEGGPQTQGQELLIRLSRARALGTVVTKLGPFASDFPRRLAIAVSVDGDTWEEVWNGPTDTVALVGALQHPKQVPLVLPLGDKVGRYIRLRSVAGDPVFYWSIAEVSVHAPFQ